MSFSVLTLNLWNINEPLEPRYRALDAGLRKLRPDIICVQEVGSDPKTIRSQSQFIAEMSGLAHVVEKHSLAIVSRYPVGLSRCVALPEFPGDGPRFVLLAECSIGGRPLLVANTHLAYPPEMIAERRQQTDVLLAALKNFSSKRDKPAKLLCGDFNDVAESPTVRAVLESDEKFHDVFAECNPLDPGITYSCQKNRYVDRYWTTDQRIDYIFAGIDLTPLHCRIVFDGNNGLDLVSDHFGVVGRFDFR